jgi:hypothetical protein
MSALLPERVKRWAGQFFGQQLGPFQQQQQQSTAWRRLRQGQAGLVRSDLHQGFHPAEDEVSFFSIFTHSFFKV